MIAWHFTGDTLRDGRPVPRIGEKLVHDEATEGAIEMCVRGLHASGHPFDALFFAPGPMLHKVECGGRIIEGGDKIVCTERTILASVDFEPHLWTFARQQALSVIHLWNAPDVVRRYLETGDETLRAAVGSAARAAAWDAARAAAWDAAWDAARAAALDAARDAARAAARAAAWDAAWDAARDAAWDAARDAAWDAARAAALDAARAAFAGIVSHIFKDATNA